MILPVFKYSVAIRPEAHVPYSSVSGLDSHYLPQGIRRGNSCKGQGVGLHICWTKLSATAAESRIGLQRSRSPMTSSFPGPFPIAATSIYRRAIAKWPGRSGSGGYGVKVSRFGDDLETVIECHTEKEFWQLVVAVETTPAFLRSPRAFEDMASAVLLDRHPFDRIVQWRTVAKVLSMGFVTGMRVLGANVLLRCSTSWRMVRPSGQRHREHEVRAGRHPRGSCGIS